MRAGGAMKTDLVCPESYLRMHLQFLSYFYFGYRHQTESRINVKKCLMLCLNRFRLPFFLFPKHADPMHSSHLFARSETS